MLNRLLSIFLPLLLIFSLSPSNAFSEDSTPRRLRIAVIIPLTGQLASLGTSAKNGISLAFEQLDANVKKNVELIYEDDQFDPKKTLAIYERLSVSSRLDAIFVLGSATANALAPKTEQQKQILVAIGASDPNIVKNRKFAFIHWVIPSVLGEKLGNELLRRNFQRIAIVTAESSGALADAEAVRDFLIKKGAQNRIVEFRTFSQTDTDFRSSISAIKQKRADAVIVILFPGALSSFMKQARELNVSAELIGMETFEDAAEVAAADGALQGKWYVNGSDPSATFIELYRKHFGTHPGWAAGNAYDTLNLLVTSFSTSTSKNGIAEIRDFLATLKSYNGACGTYSASGDNRFLLPAALKRVTTDGFITIDRSDLQ